MTDQSLFSLVAKEVASKLRRSWAQKRSLILLSLDHLDHLVTDVQSTVVVHGIQLLKALQLVLAHALSYNMVSSIKPILQLAFLLQKSNEIQRKVQASE